jgi:hypothetical protein
MTLRTFGSVVALVGLMAAAVPTASRWLTDPAALPPHDFVEYWSAARLHLGGENPYDPVRMHELERDHIGWDPVGQPIMMWNPPWTLTFVFPLGLMPWKVAQIAWLIARFAMLAASAWLLGRVYDRKPLASGVFVATWLPCYIALQYGQIPPLMLLGFAGFLWATTTDRPFVAGLFGVLIAVKPHLAIFVWLAIARQAIVERQWRIVAGGVVGGLLASAIPLAIEPTVFHQYIEATRTVPPVQWVTPTIGAWLRLLGGTTAFWPQWIPLAVGLVWFARNSVRRGLSPTDWPTQLPALLLASFVCAPYGCWPYDLTLLVVPLAAMADRGLTKGDVAVYVIVSLGMLALAMVEVEAKWFVGVAPVIALQCARMERRVYGCRSAAAQAPSNCGACAAA